MTHWPDFPTLKSKTPEGEPVMLAMPRKTAFALIMGTYRDEPCRICGSTIGLDHSAVYAGYSQGNTSRSAHGACWKKYGNTPEMWALK